MAIDYSKRKKGQSKREYKAEIEGSTSPATKKSSGASSKSSGGSNINSIVKSILGATPGFNNPSKTFDEYYTADQQAQDRTASEAMYKPHFEQQIANSLEDLNSWSEMDSVSYKRTLRQGRANMAKIGAAVGSERSNWEADVNAQQKSGIDNQVRQTERSVGSTAIKNAGYSSMYGDRLGTITDTMNASIEDQVLWYKDQAQGQYNINSNATYKSPSNTNYLGKSL